MDGSRWKMNGREIRAWARVRVHFHSTDQTTPRGFFQPLASVSPEGCCHDDLHSHSLSHSICLLE